MKTKLEMAHEYAMQHLKNSGGKITMHSLCLFAWQYADAMQAEADKRNKEESAQKRKAIREMLNADNTFLEKEGHHFDDVEWQPDWSQAPENTTHWGMELGSAYWLKEEGGRLFYKIGEAPLFGYTGNQQDSLRKRPEL